MRPTRRAATLLLAILVLTAVLAVVFWWDREPPAPPPPGITSDSSLTAFYEQEVDWSSCGADRCAQITVPVDYGDPDGETLDIDIRMNGDGEGPVLFINPGGPGGSGVDYLSYFAGRTSEELRAQYSIAGFDPRGVGRSEPLQCLSDSEFIGLLEKDPTPDDHAELEESVRDYATMGEACLENSGSLTEHVTTVEVAHDLDLMRVVLRQARLHFYGASYGTELGATYAGLYPERVGRFVLDSAVDLEADDLEQGLGQTRGFQRAFESFAAWCVAGGDCEAGASVDDANANVAALLAGLEDEPLPAAGGRELLESYGFYGVAVALYNKDYWPMLKAALNEAIGKRDGSALLRLSDAYFGRTGDRFADNSGQVITAIRCLEGGETRSLEQQRDDLAEFEKASPVFGPFLAWSTSCIDWPVKTGLERPDYGRSGETPILVVGTTNDPATPYEWSEAMAGQLQNGVLLTKEGDGHGAYGSGNACIDRHVERFLLQGSVPDDGSEC